MLLCSVCPTEMAEASLLLIWQALNPLAYQCRTAAIYPTLSGDYDVNVCRPVVVAAVVHGERQLFSQRICPYYW